MPYEFHAESDPSHELLAEVAGFAPVNPFYTCVYRSETRIGFSAMGGDSTTRWQTCISLYGLHEVRLPGPVSRNYLTPRVPGLGRERGFLGRAAASLPPTPNLRSVGPYLRFRCSDDTSLAR